jgi:hypothetical protein
MRILHNTNRCFGGRWGALVGILALMAGPLLGQGALPDAPDGFKWVSQGVFVYADSDSFSADLGVTTSPGVFGQSTLNVPISLTAFNPMPAANEHIVIHSSIYEASLSGLGSAVVLNLDPGARDFLESVSIKGWEIVGVDGTTGSTDQALDRDSGDPQVVAMLSGALYGDMMKGTTLTQDLSVNGIAPTGPLPVNFQFNGTFDVDLASTATNAQIFGNGSAFGDASLQTVYEPFRLMVIPEPSTALLALMGIGGVFRRRR